VYNIELFPNIFAEGEILCMDDDFIDSLGRLLDDKISIRIVQFFERFEKSGIRDREEDPIAKAITGKVDRMREMLGERILKNTFHLEVISRKVLEFVSQLNIDTALIVIENRKEAIETLTWLLANREYWSGYIAVRQKADFEDFAERCQNLVFATRSLDQNLRSAGMPNGIRHYENLMIRIKANKEFFYSPNEKKRPTRMTSLMNIVHVIQMVLHGLTYQELCSKMEIPKFARRSFRA
jgi:hypothetical protein